jgi:hypothetical protein
LVVRGRSGPSTRERRGARPTPLAQMTRNHHARSESARDNAFLHARVQIASSPGAARRGTSTAVENLGAGIGSQCVLLGAASRRRASVGPGMAVSLWLPSPRREGMWTGPSRAKTWC